MIKVALIFISEMQGWFNTYNSINIINYINSLLDKKIT